VNAWRPLISREELIVEFDVRGLEEVEQRATDAARMLFTQLSDPKEVRDPGARVIMRCEVWLANQTGIHARAIAAFNTEWAQLVPGWTDPHVPRDQEPPRG
jgi:hypothetical protein